MEAVARKLLRRDVTPDVASPDGLGQQVKKSAVVELALEADRERRLENLLREGYEEMAEHDTRLLEEFEHVDREPPCPEFSE